ncbi:MAG: hypothetical protein N3F07_01780 [Candidatus Micrarchaeota archaeon]|nr:hypothetical protein [Candidatus Micrarchaeota archaeon]
MLITTSKKPSLSSKKLARVLFAAIPGSSLEFRGKRSLERLMLKAKKSKMARLCAIYQKNGEPCQLRFMRISEGECSWLGDSISIRKVFRLKMPKRGQKAASLRIAGSMSGKLRRLFGISSQAGQECREKAEAAVKSSASRLSVMLDGEKMLELGVRYVKQR